MALRINTFLLLFFLLLIPLYSSMVQGFKETDDTSTKPIIYSLHEAVLRKDGVQPIRWRKLAMLDVDAVLDYDDVSANPRHDPRRRSGGGSP